ncbi:cytochrome c nitrite reductase small subunit [Apibacter raozihei]|uniref:cytochrome c nitrite reductase small subunit n=1 Tax=Apibacter TaxID=1778601 RepID=UPI000FE3F0A8|nr:MULTISPECIES: cytochrome c nitrite reductase small subunit [Apibacter]
MTILKKIPKKFVFPIFLLISVGCGLIAYLFYISRATSYLSDDPKACVNCHIMTPYYQSWQHSSHGRVTNCNDCHVPHNNVISKYAFKAKDGLYHAAVFTLDMQPQVIRPRKESYEVIMNNCIRCHSDLNTSMVNTGKINYTHTLAGDGKACWECHTEVPHTKNININSSPSAIVPLPPSPVPDWLMRLTEKQKEKENNKIN